VREHVLQETGLELPIIEATPDTLKQVLTTLVSNPPRMHGIAEAGRSFVHAVHDGRLSSMSLAKHWIEKD
jgi:hypothetical protein